MGSDIAVWVHMHNSWPMNYELMFTRQIILSGFFLMECMEGYIPEILMIEIIAILLGRGVGFGLGLSKVQ